MNQKQYTWSNKDKKFLVAVLFVQLSLVMLAVSLFGLYYKGQVNECVKLNKKLELADWAEGEVNKAKAEYKLKLIQESYKDQGISAEEY